MKTLPLKSTAVLLAAGLLASITGCDQGSEPDGVSTAQPYIAAASDIDAGRYLIVVGGCNDCHTSGWDVTGGAIPEEDWLLGSAIGWRGPWGTTYASNLRIIVNEIDEEAFVTMLATRTDRPPMPWMNMNRLNPSDARAIYRYIRSLELRGERMPVAVGPGVEPATPFYFLEPTQPRMTSAEAKGPASE